MNLNECLKTESLCPVCLKKIDASIVTEGKNSYMVKSCPLHGTFKTVLWRGGITMEKWARDKERAYIEKAVTKEDKGCPFDCGLCAGHRQHTCTALIEVTGNCNLHCEFCFADSSGAMAQDPSLKDIEFRYRSILQVSGICNIQLSGGEPTVRNDLPQVIEMGKDLGFNFIQVNTNGIRMAEDEDYVRSLKKSGLSSIYLQFDGTQDEIYQKLRGKALFEKKLKTIENCRKHEIGVVLVPTLVPGINVDNIGKIITFGIKHAPTVRGVHFQPVSYFGRMPGMPEEKDRVTLPEVMEEISRQTQGMILTESMKPPGCENALCSFHGSYMIENDSLMQVTKRSDCLSGMETAEEGARKAKAFVSRNWSSSVHGIKKRQQEKYSDWDKILNKIRRNSFSISAMAFQDVWNLNLERIRDCCIHVAAPDGRLIPFCMYNLTSAEGRTLYRK